MKKLDILLYLDEKLLGHSLDNEEEMDLKELFIKISSEKEEKN